MVNCNPFVERISVYHSLTNGSGDFAPFSSQKCAADEHSPMQCTQANTKSTENSVYCISMAVLTIFDNILIITETIIQCSLFSCTLLFHHHDLLHSFCSFIFLMLKPFT